MCCLEANLEAPQHRQGNLTESADAFQRASWSPVVESGREGFFAFEAMTSKEWVTMGVDALGVRAESAEREFECRGGIQILMRTGTKIGGAKVEN